MHKNIKSVGKLLYGRGAFDQLDAVLAPIRAEATGPMVFLVDDYFEDRPLARRLPTADDDQVLFVDASHKEPTTEQVDGLRDGVLAEGGVPAGVIGIGGGSVMDLAKALALMVTNEGSSTRYQGLNLIRVPGVYHVGVPTISGTGAECSTTAVLTGPEKKLGLKCEWTPFDQIVLDPELLATVPRDHWFYTGMDCYIHCIESAAGALGNAFSRAYGDQALALCRQVFLDDGSGQTPDNDDRLMVASLFGGLSLTASEVGVCHALSYGLSYVLGIRHGLANCLAFNHLSDFYPDGVAEFHRMLEHHDIPLPHGLSSGWTDSEVTQMAQTALALEHMWRHAVGPEWQQAITVDVIKALYYRL